MGPFLGLGDHSRLLDLSMRDVWGQDGWNEQLILEHVPDFGLNLVGGIILSFHEGPDVRLIGDNRLLLKVRVFLWRLANDALPLDANVQKKDPYLASKRSFCEETKCLEHLFLCCPQSSQVWMKVCTFYNIHFNDFSRHSFLSTWWIHSAKSSVKRQLIIVILAYGCWEIWKSHNNKRFEDRYTSSDQLVHIVLSQILQVTTIFPPSCKSAKDFIWQDKRLVGKLRRVGAASPIVLKWSPHPNSVHKLNMDDAFRVVKGLALGGGALRNHQDKILAVDHMQIEADSVILIAAITDYFVNYALDSNVCATFTNASLPKIGMGILWLDGIGCYYARGCTVP
ncbi:hypothetical protein ACH5RR_026003 [Cinchona calisaya]|uniref:Reverse transcriptase zinc-binding domain-containing protein n=1 Tax=Cinchona calisaya TaxID=153742 RepID=A0ABD2Z1M5_9GENT